LIAKIRKGRRNTPPPWLSMPGEKEEKDYDDSFSGVAYDLSRRIERK